MNSQLIIVADATDKDRERARKQIDAKQVAVFIHLHYLDTLEKYFRYMDIVPDEVPVYVSTSSLDVERRIQEYIFTRKKKQIEIILKKNRGRDITSFLVALRKKIIRYKYFCFVHDKKEKRKSQREDVEHWIDNLWGNLLGMQNALYFFKIIALFEENANLGLLAPPEPMGESFKYDNGWGELNISSTKALAKDLNLQIDINMDIDQQPIALGTCFWARKDALSKLLVRKWEYEDFDDEPLPDCGKCYAVERILEYVVEDAGYNACNIMSYKYAEKYMRFLMTNRRAAFKILHQRYAFTTYSQLKKLEEICQYFDYHKEIYLYGAGKVGEGMCKYLQDTNRYPKGFIVSEKTSKQTYLSLPIKSIDEMIFEKNTGIIVSAEGDNVTAIVSELEKRGILDFICMSQ